MNSKLFILFGLVLMLVIAGCVSDAEKTAKKKAKDADKGKTPAPQPAKAPGAKEPQPSPQPTPAPSPQPTPQPPPQSPALPQRSGTYTMRTLIAEVSDRDVLDRWGPGIYSLAGPETSSDAHPFANGGQGLSGVSDEELFRIDGTMFSPFADITLTDAQTGTSYAEKQYIFVQTHVQYRDAMDAVGGRFKDFVYQIKFEPGIPTTVRDIQIKYKNGNSVLNSIEPPRDVQIQSEGQVVSGGSIQGTFGGRIRDGDTLDGGWKVRLTWKGQVGASPDQLRSIILYKDISDFLRSGEGYDIGGSNRFTFKFIGLDKSQSSSADYDTFRCEFVDLGNSRFSYVADGSTNVARESSATGYVKCRTDVSGGFSTAAGDGSEFRVLLLTNSNARLDTSISNGDSGFANRPTLYPGDVILKLEGAPERWVYVGTFNTGGSVEIDYPTAGASRNMEMAGAIKIGWGGVSGWSVNGVDFSSTSLVATNIGNTGGLVILLSEEAGPANKPDAIAAYFDIVAKSFNRDSPNARYLRDKCTVASVSAFARTTANYDLEGSVNMPTQREINYVTHRGTVCKELSDTMFTWKVAKQVAHAEFELRAE